jgi:hypothetical protein
VPSVVQILVMLGTPPVIPAFVQSAARAGERIPVQSWAFEKLGKKKEIATRRTTERDLIEPSVLP